MRIYPHLDVDAVDESLRGADRSIVVTDTVFSMDGDVAPVTSLAEVCRRHGAMLVVVGDASLGMYGRVFPALRAAVPAYRGLRAPARFAIHGTCA